MELCPRPGHVYLGLADFPLLEGELYLEEKPEAGHINPYYAVLAVDLSKLDPALINPDEDAYWMHGEWDTLKHQHCTHAHVKPYTYDDLEVNGAAYDSFGAWAEGIRLGDDPEHTECGIKTSHTLAYNGTIKPEWMTLQECALGETNGRLFWEHRPATRSLEEILGAAV
jgi:hypothetical protein